ncbi:MAG: S-layer homology domain-containing protein [Clostridia bacterium]|nr:S-layer homology domain-containing protein [Clostridia bacterium]
MKRKLKFLGIIGICTALTLSCITFAEEQHNTGSSTGIYTRDESKYSKNPSSWAVEGIDGMRANGLAANDFLTNFDKPITRQEFATLVVNVYYKGKNSRFDISKNTTTPFADESDPIVVEAYNLGIVKGVGDGKFEPYAEIERQAVCTMLLRLISGVQGNQVDAGKINLSKFKDAGQVEDWAKPAVSYCNAKGIMTGTSDTTLSPKDSLTREQALVLLYRLSVSNGYIKKEAQAVQDYYMLNGFKVPKETTMQISGNIGEGTFVSAGSYDQGKNVEQHYKDLKFILTSKLPENIVDPIIDKIKSNFSQGIGLYKTTVFGEYEIIYGCRVNEGIGVTVRKK